MRFVRCIATVFGVTTLALYSCGGDDEVGRVSVHQLEKFLVQEGYVVVDTREPPIFVAGHIPDSVSVPMDMIRSWGRALPSTTRVILYCD